MNAKSFTLATIGYVAATFAIAILWHLILFKGTYDQLGYIARKEPGFALGALSMVVQGAVLAYLFPLFSRGKNTLREGIRFSLLMGIFFWSCHVLGSAAKQNIAPLSTFVPLESAYLLLQFILAGLILGWAYRPAPS